MVDNIYHTERKKEGAVDGDLENPSVFTHHSSRQKKYFQRSNERKNRAYWIPPIQNYVRSMYAELTLATFLTTPIVWFPFHFFFMEFLPALSSYLGRLCDPERGRWKPRFHSPIGSKPSWARNYLRDRNSARYFHNWSLWRTISSLYQVDIQSEHAQNEKHLKTTERNFKGRIRAIYSW